jgi:acyl carrier protein
MDHIGTVRDFVVQNFLFGDGKLLEDDTSFLGQGIIDSTGILELVLFLEQAYNIKIEDEELIPENLDSLRNITRFLKSKLNSNPPHSQQSTYQTSEQVG